MSLRMDTPQLVSEQQAFPVQLEKTVFPHVHFLSFGSEFRHGARNENAVVPNLGGQTKGANPQFRHPPKTQATCKWKYSYTATLHPPHLAPAQRVAASLAAAGGWCA